MAEEKNENMISKGVRLTPTTWDECDKKAEELGLRSRNEFIRDAITFYLEWLDSGKSVKFLTPALESVIGAKVRDSERRLTAFLFRLAVGQNYLAHIVGDAYNFDSDYLTEQYRDSAREVRETNGTLRLDAILSEANDG